MPTSSKPGVDQFVPLTLPAELSPVVEAVEALVGQELGGPVVEVGVELVDHGLISEDREQTNRKRWNGNQISSNNEL